jgi:hypothetical protein
LSIFLNAWFCRCSKFDAKEQFSQDSAIPLTIHEVFLKPVWFSIQNWNMNVESAKEISSSISSHLQRITSQSRCNPCPDSNLATLKRAAQYFRLYQAFTGVELVQNHETELKRGKQLLR